MKQDQSQTDGAAPVSSTPWLAPWINRKRRAWKKKLRVAKSEDEANFARGGLESLDWAEKQ